MMSDAGAGARVASVDTVLRGWINVDGITITIRDGEPVERHSEDHGPGAAVLPDDGQVRTARLVSQPRAAVLLAG